MIPQNGDGDARGLVHACRNDVVELGASLLRRSRRRTRGYPRRRKDLETESGDARRVHDEFGSPSRRPTRQSPRPGRRSRSERTTESEPLRGRIDVAPSVGLYGARLRNAFREGAFPPRFGAPREGRSDASRPPTSAPSSRLSASVGPKLDAAWSEPRHRAARPRGARQRRTRRVHRDGICGAAA